MREEDGQEYLLPPSDDEDALAETAGLTTAQLILKFPDLAPPKYIPEECRKMDESKRYNGQRYKRDHPEAYKWLVKCLAADLGYREIQRLGGPKYYVVKAIAFEAGIAIKEQKRHLSNLCAMGSELYVEKAMELAESTKSGKDASIAAGILMDKHLQFSGDAAVKIELTHKVDFAGEVKSLHDKIMERFANMKRAEIVEVEPEALPAQ